MESHDIRAALTRSFVHPEAAVMFEVSTGTGGGAGRYVDAVVMDLWPSRGLALTAVEIKVSRGDLLRELKQPEKSEAIAKYCDYFCIAAPKGMVKPDELPLAWGLYEIDEDGSLKTKIKPRKTDSEPVTRSFLAAVLRSQERHLSNKLKVLDDQRAKTVEARIEERVGNFLERVNEAVRQRVGDEKGKEWAAFRESLGEGDYTLTEAHAIKLFKLIRAVGIDKTYNGVASMIDNMERAAKRGREIMATFESGGSIGDSI